MTYVVVSYYKKDKLYLQIWTLDFTVKDEGFLDLVSCNFVNCIWSTQGKFVALNSYFLSTYIKSSTKLTYCILRSPEAQRKVWFGLIGQK